MIQDLLVTVFVPVYNGEKYLNETLLSIQNQTYTNFEVLLVDDSSTDESKIILDKFASVDSRFKVFTKKNGGMVSVSWNFIMPEIKGDYMFYSSQDDIFSIDLLEKMVEKQKESKADTILPDMEFYFENKQNNKKIIGLNGNRAIVLTGKQACGASLNGNIHGFTLTKTSLIRNEYFPEDAFDSDEFITRKLFLKSNNVVFSEGVFYYRQDNLNAITKTFTAKNFYKVLTQFRIYKLLQENDFDKKYIFDWQFSVLYSYLKLRALFKLYDFETNIEKEEVSLFLFNFRKQQFTNSFYFSNSVYIIMMFKIRLILLLIVYKVPFLLNFMINFHVKRLRKKSSFIQTKLQF